MSLKRKTRHFHAGKLRKTVGGVEFVEFAESKGKVFVSKDGRVITPRVVESYGGSKCSYNNGYREVRIAGVPAVIHRVVFEVFRGAIPDGMEVDHINAVASNNRLENLRVVTSKENSANPITRKRMLMALSVSIEKAIKAHKKPVVGIAADETVAGPFEDCRHAARFVGISYKALSQALTGHSKSSGGYVWKEVVE